MNICLEHEDLAHSRTILQVSFWYCNGSSLTNELFTLVTSEVEFGKKKKTWIIMKLEKLKCSPNQPK
jgi:hypothetical protein